MILWPLFASWLPIFMQLYQKSFGEPEEQKVEWNGNKGIQLTPSKRLQCVAHTGGGCKLDVPTLRFFIVGDIGGLLIYPYASYAQHKVARAMGKIADKSPVQFVVNLGDNFYFNGVKTVFDSRFEGSFEEVYTYHALNVPWYTIAGNHDHLGNLSAQQKYTMHSSKWTFPDRLFYKLSIDFGKVGDQRTTVDILMLDTIVLCGNTIDIQGESLFSWLFSKKKNLDGPEPEYKKLAEEQWKWIEESLQNSTADYLLVAGHYPIYSSCEHGQFDCLLRNLDPLLRKHGANVYLSGHDHNLQHIKRSHRDDNGSITSMNYVVCGAASRTDRSSKHVDDFAEGEIKFRYPTGWNPFSQIGFSSGGFILAVMKDSDAVLKFFTNKRQLKYELPLTKRKGNM